MRRGYINHKLDIPLCSIMYQNNCSKDYYLEFFYFVVRMMMAEKFIKLFLKKIEKHNLLY